MPHLFLITHLSTVSALPSYSCIRGCPCFNFLLKTNHIHVLCSLPGGLNSKVIRRTSFFFCFRPHRARKLSFQAASASAGDESCSCEGGNEQGRETKILEVVSTLFAHQQETSIEQEREKQSKYFDLKYDGGW